MRDIRVCGFAWDWPPIVAFGSFSPQLSSLNQLALSDGIFNLMQYYLYSVWNKCHLSGQIYTHTYVCVCHSVYPSRTRAAKVANISFESFVIVLCIRPRSRYIKKRFSLHMAK